MVSKAACKICAGTSTEHNHEASDIHQRNLSLLQFSRKKKSAYKNIGSIIVTCNADNVKNSSKPKVTASTKPDEEVTFSFSVKNESRSVEVILLNVLLAHSKFNFIPKNELAFPVYLKPKCCIPNIDFTFTSSEIGQYQVPIVFSFQSQDSKDLIIVRDMVVFVEEQATPHEKVANPYEEKDIKADRLIRGRKQIAKYQDSYPVDPRLKAVFASKLKITEKTTNEDITRIEEIKNIFDIGITRTNYIQFFRNLLWFEETVKKSNGRKFNMSNVTLSKTSASYILVVPGVEEKRPSLILGDSVFVMPTNQKENTVMFDAYINKIEDSNVFLKGFHKDFSAWYGEGAQFDVRFYPSRVTFERMLLALHSLSRDDHFARVFPSPATVAKKNLPVKEYFNKSVGKNREQRIAVEHILAGTSGRAPYFVHGPPGTGKTVTIVEAILQLVKKDPANRILVCTDSNMAADHVAVQILEYAHLFEKKNFLLRANSLFRDWETMPKCLKTYSNGFSRGSYKSVKRSSFVTHKIAITTLSHSAKFVNWKNLNGHVSHLFVDEAAQASEPALLVPMVGLLRASGVLVLAGDPRQLGPVLLSQDAAAAGLGKSLMERLKEKCPLYSDERQNHDYMVMLRENFRSDSAILSIPNELFYNGLLRSSNKSPHPLSKVDILGTKSFSHAIVFHGVLSKEQRVGKSPSYFNDMEVQKVKEYVKALVSKHDVKPVDIGIVTPYLRQAYKIKIWLKSQTLSAIEVGTVESFQGKEKLVIIISTVRAKCNLLDVEAKFKLGFLVDDKRFNVAMTRAKVKLIVIGNPLCLCKDVKWLAYMQRCRALGSYLGFDGAAYDELDAQNFVRSLLQKMNI